MSVSEHTAPATSFPRRLVDHEPNLATLSQLRASGRLPSLARPARRNRYPRAAVTRAASPCPGT